MGVIRILPPEVVNQIAAGEVIERPASVVKELVENALDAGATRVRIDVEEGGRRRIAVRDDGKGIAPEDLPLAFAPHATSKLAGADDLFRISSFGFRGEALASIGSVAQVTITSRLRGSAEGAEISADAGSVSRVRPAASAEGTLVDVRNLFGSVPARRKFLRSVDVEMGHIEEAVTRFAIAHPGVRFEFAADGVERLLLPPARDLKERLAAFFDRGLVDALVEVSSEAPGAAFTLWAAPPKFARLSMKGQYVFLNGRFIRDRVLSRAIHEGFREMVPHGRHPVAILFLRLDPAEVDVNVHPTKIEVRFRNVWRLHDRIAGALREKLLGSDLAPHLTSSVLEGGGPRRDETFQAIAEFFQRDAAAGTAVLPAAAPPAADPLLQTGRRYIQLHDRYVVEEVEDGIRIIDQHALHERVLLDEIRRQYASSDVARQALLLPAVLEVSTRERARLEEHRALLESLGVQLEDFGPSSVVVRTVPALLRDEDPVSLVRDVLDRLEAHGASEKKAGHAIPMVDEALEFLACRAAVKFGERLQPEALVELLRKAAGLDYSATCAHGRPTAVKLTLADLEKHFKRKTL